MQICTTFEYDFAKADYIERVLALGAFVLLLVGVFETIRVRHARIVDLNPFEAFSQSAFR